MKLGQPMSEPMDVGRRLVAVFAEDVEGDHYFQTLARAYFDEFWTLFENVQEILVALGAPTLSCILSLHLTFCLERSSNRR